jgi:hypothetical protein
MEQKKAAIVPFTGYQKLIIALLALLQFTVVLDFMILSPLATFLMKSLEINPPGLDWLYLLMHLALAAQVFLPQVIRISSTEKNTTLFLYWIYCGTFFLRNGE